MKNFCYCIGGTGARVAEVAAHLCAVNLVGEQDITFIIVDKDASCGGTLAAKEVVNSIAELSGVENGALGLRRTNFVEGTGKKEFCKSRIRVDTRWDFSTALERIAPMGAAGASGLEISLTTAGKKKEDEILFDALYSEEEQTRDTARGFYGHPSIGASIFNFMIKKGKWDVINDNDNRDLNEDDIAYPIKHHLLNNPDDQAKVFIIGSIFGGTGASIFSNLAQHLRNSLNVSMRNRLFVSGALLLPYFTFAAERGGRVDNTEFYEKSRTALLQYSNEPDFFKKNPDGKGAFDSLYICGQTPPHTTAEKYSDGGKEQRNHFDFVDLAAAKAMTEFFAADTEEKLKPIIGGKVFEYRLSTGQGNDETIISLRGNTDMHRELIAMLSFCAYVYTRIYGQLVIAGEDPWNVPMTRHLFGRAAVTGLINPHPTPEYTNNIYPAIKNVAESVFNYCHEYVRFVYDIAMNGHDFSDENTNPHDEEYSFFDVEYVRGLSVIGDFLRSNNRDAAAKEIDKYFRKKGYLPGVDIGCSPEEVENELIKIFAKVTDRYNREDVAPELRMGDFIHEAFKYCYARVEQ